MLSRALFVVGTLVVLASVQIQRASAQLEHDRRMKMIPKADVQVSHVKFQTGDFDTIDSYMDNDGALPDLTQFTLCTHIKYHHVALNNTVLSYFASGRDNELTIFTNSLEAETLQLFCCGGRVRNYVHYPIRLYTWEHICLTVNLRTKQLKAFINNEVKEYTISETVADPGDSEPLVVKGGGRLVLGQDLDSEDGGFSIEQILSCEIADFAIYDVVLTEDEIRSFMSCKNTIPFHPIIYVDEKLSVLRPVGETEVGTISEREICTKENGYNVLFPERVTFRESVAWCEMLKGKVILPASEAENVEVYDMFFPFREICLDSWRTLYYFGTIRNTTTDEWFTYNTKTPIPYENFDVQWNRISSDYECAAVGNHIFKYIWFAVPCKSAMCSACNFTIVPKFRIRGLCPTSLLDHSYFLNNYLNMRPLFDGAIHSSIYWGNTTWEMRSRRHKDLSSKMLISRSKEYPFGRQSWIISGDKCGNGQADLLMTPCTDSEYTCNTGHCINKRQRCNLAIDCEDQSDELNCDVVDVPSGYSSALPPPKITEAPLELPFSLRIITIRRFNLASFTIIADSVMSLKWRDSRLTFRNLRKDYHVNKVREPELLWQPKILVRDGARSAADLQIRSENLYVQVEDEPLPDDITIISEDDRYSGGNNTLVMEIEATIEFTCQFQLQMYPVDRQKCYLLFTIPGLSKEFGSLAKDGEGIIFEGTRRLLEYQMIRETVSVETEGEGTYVRVGLEFRNLYGYYIGNTFVPSLFLVIIVYLTLYFDTDDFENRIMVSLMSLLVLATFFTETSSSIPRTSYLKLIDAWYVALICQNFMVIVCLVVVENLRLRERVATKVTPIGVKAVGGSEKSRQSLHIKANFLLKFVFPTILFVNLVAFFSFWTNL